MASDSLWNWSRRSVGRLYQCCGTTLRQIRPGNSSGNMLSGVTQAAKMLEVLGTGLLGSTTQVDATTQSDSDGKIVSTDPPYYDNIGYADLSDFFYVWLRRSLRQVFPDLFATLAVPKVEELVATPYRHNGSKKKAESFFMNGMTKAVRRLAEQTHPAMPVTIYYAFKQSESKGNAGYGQHGVGDIPGGGDRCRICSQRDLASAYRVHW